MAFITVGKENSEDTKPSQILKLSQSVRLHSNMLTIWQLNF